MKMADFNIQNEAEMEALESYLIDVGNQKEGRLMSNPNYSQCKLIRHLSDNINKGEDNVAVFIVTVSAFKQDNFN